MDRWSAVRSPTPGTCSSSSRPALSTPEKEPNRSMSACASGLTSLRGMVSLSSSSSTSCGWKPSRSVRTARSRRRFL